MSAQAWNMLSLRTYRVHDFFSLSGGNCRDFFYPNFESSYLLNWLTDWLDFLYGNIIWPCLLMCEDSRNFRYCNQLNQPTYPKISNQRSQKSILWNFLKFSMNNHPTPGQILGELYGDHMITLAIITWSTFFIRKLFSTSLQIPKQSSSRGILMTNLSFDVILLTASRFHSLD